MSVNDKIRCYNGVINWLESNSIDIGKPKKKTHRAIEEHINNILIKFGKDNSIEMIPNNKKNYRGSYSPSLSNAVTVSKHFQLFTNWIMKNYG